MKKNGKIELLRFIFSIGVLCLHIQKYLPGEVSLKEGIRFHFFPYGAMGVEFFFVLSGFLMAASVFYANERQKSLPLGEATFRFIKSKFTSLMPMRLLVFVLLFAATLLTKSWGIATIVKKLLSYVPGFFLVQMSGFGEPYLNHIEWYLSVMLIGMLIIYPLLRKDFDVFSKIVAPAVAVLILGYMYQSYGRLSGVTSWEGLCYRSMLRGIAELCLGVMGFAICQHITETKPSGLRRLAITCCELVCWGATFTMMLLTLPRVYEFYMLFFITVGAICSFTGLSFGSELFNNKVCFYLGKLSLPIYLCQLIPIALVPKYFSSQPMKLQMALTFVATMILSVMIYHLSGALSKGKQPKRAGRYAK